MIRTQWSDEQTFIYNKLHGSVFFFINLCYIMITAKISLLSPIKMQYVIFILVTFFLMKFIKLSIKLFAQALLEFVQVAL